MSAAAVRGRLTVPVCAVDLLPGNVIVQQMRVTGLSCRRVLGVERAVRGGTEWVVAEAVDDRSSLRLWYPLGYQVPVERSTVDPWRLAPPPVLPPDRPVTEGLLRVRSGRAAVTAHLIPRGLALLSEQGTRATGFVLCGRSLAGRVVPDRDTRVRVCQSCEQAVTAREEAG